MFAGGVEIKDIIVGTLIKCITVRKLHGYQKPLQKEQKKKNNNNKKKDSKTGQEDKGGH